MKPERHVAPEYNLEWPDAVPAPIIGARHFGERIFRGIFRDLFFERPAAFHRPRLGGSPSADLAVLWSCRKIGVGFRRADFAHRAAGAHRAAKTLPMKIDRGDGVDGQLVALG